MRRIRIGVLFGGRSGEHEVSLMSARSIIGALDPKRYEVIPIGITRDGVWKRPNNALELLQQGQLDALQESLTTSQTAVALDPKAKDVPPLDVVFPVLHGPYGEDGTVQGFLELANLPYVGSGVLGSAVSMDKSIMRRLFAEAGLPLVPWRSSLRSRWQQDPESVLTAIEEQLGYPCFVKPANLGSSVGISRARSRHELEAALTTAAQYDRKLVVERGVVNAREIEVSVLGNDEPQASLAGEIRPGGEFYDYATKYLEDSSELLVPAPLSPEQQEQFQQLAVGAFQAVDACGMARVDFFLAEDGTIFVNEINTIPGFTRISMYPKLWEASGVAYGQLLDRLIELAVERHEDKAKNKATRI